MLERLERQEKLTPNQWKIIATANVGDMLDFFDFFLIGYAKLSNPDCRIGHDETVRPRRRHRFLSL